MRVLSVLVLSLVPCLVFGQFGAEPEVVASLITDTPTVAPGAKFRAGVLLEIPRGWYIYWKNPGESGLPTTIEWQPTLGVQFGELQFPMPWTFESPGPVTSYGYRDEVLLISDVQVASTASLPLRLVARVSWLMCSKSCIPGETTVSIELGGGATEKDVALFSRYERLLPQADGTDDVRTSLTRVGNQHLASIVIPNQKRLAAEDEPPDLHRVFFFPEEVPGYVIAVPQVSGATETARWKGRSVQTHDGPVSVQFKLTPSKRDAQAPVIRGILVSQELPEKNPVARILCVK